MSEVVADSCVAAKWVVAESDSGKAQARALEIAIAYDRSVYDAVFVALVERPQARGVTSDVKLHRAVVHDFPAIELL